MEKLSGIFQAKHLLQMFVFYQFSNSCKNVNWKMVHTKMNEEIIKQFKI